MKNLLVPLFVVMFVSASGQKIFQEKIGVGYSTYNDVEDYNQASYGSRVDITFGFLMMNLDKKFSLRKELGFEMFMMKGYEDTGGLGGHSYYNDLKGYSLILTLKLQPVIKFSHGAYFFVGPVGGSNLYSHWKYHLSWYYLQDHYITGSKQVSESASDQFSRLFWGLEAGFGNQVALKNGNRCGFEFSAFYYFDFAEGFDRYNQFNRFGFRVSFVNPTGLIFRKKGPAVKIKSDVTN